MNTRLYRTVAFSLLSGLCILGLTKSSLAQSEPVTVNILKNVMMPARDGTRLATDVYLPLSETGQREDGARWPAILIRTPYNKQGAAGLGEFFASKGYAVVIQDVRGRYASEGAFYIYVNEGEDGYDAVEWTAAQPWCNGRVGTYGGSYLAATQNALAVHRPSHLKTMFALVGTSNYVEDGAGRGGAFALLHNLTYTVRLAASGKEARADPKVAAALDDTYERLAHWLRQAPLKADSPLSRAASYQTWYADWRLHPTYDDYWKQVGYNFEEYYSDFPEIPVCLVGGWYDVFKRGTLRNFQGLSQRGGFTKLIIGPWTHSTGLSYSGDVDFGTDAKRDLRGEALGWFDQFLKGDPRRIQHPPPVEYFVMGGGTGRKNKDGRFGGGGSWKTAATWPPSGFRSQPFYLHESGALRGEQCDCGQPSIFQYDPHNPVPTVGGNIDSGKHLVPRGAQNQVAPADHVVPGNHLPLAARHDVLTFQTESLEQDVEITGPVLLKLWVASSAPDTDFTAKLIDVHPPTPDYPDGYAMNLEDGILRMRFRNSRENEELMEPGRVYPITIDLWATSNRFARGHRIRVDVSSSNFPMYDTNPNTGEPLGRHTQMRSAINTVYHDPERPSALFLPVCASSESTRSE